MARHLTRVRMEQAGGAGQRVQAGGNLRALSCVALEFFSLSGSEGLSQVFQYSISLITPDNPMLTSAMTGKVDYKPLVGNASTVTMALDGGGERHITGLGSPALHGLNRIRLMDAHCKCFTCQISHHLPD